MPHGPGPHPTPEESQALAASLNEQWAESASHVPAPLPPTQPGPGTDAHGNRKH